MKSSQRDFGEKLPKSSSILSVVAILLTCALFVRIETVARDMKIADSKFTQQIQQIKEDLKEATIRQDPETEGYGIASGRWKIFTIFRPLLRERNLPILVYLVAVL